ncbi:MAG TPA: hypothetical protein VFS44_12275 [Gemmatimonadaceae bacterium]|nr:hypothetical protein [Gemmatimonadaceae bacterium]
MTSKQVARGLGYASFGLGLAELAAPAWLEKQLGVRNHRRLVRALGAREILAGAGVLARRRPAAGLWARAAGDVMDLALLGAAARRSKRRKQIAAAMGFVLAIGAMDVLFARRMQRA